MGFHPGIRPIAARPRALRLSGLRSASAWMLAVGGSAGTAGHRSTYLSAVVAIVLLSGGSVLSTETISQVRFDLYQQHLIVTKGSVGRLHNLSLLIDTGTIPSMVDGRIARS